MSIGTDHMPDKDALTRFAHSETGKALLGQLINADPVKIKLAIEKASAGDLSGAMQSLQTLLASTDDHSRKEVSHGK